MQITFVYAVIKQLYVEEKVFHCKMFFFFSKFMMLSYVDKERSLSCMLYVEEKFFHCKMFVFFEIYDTQLC